MFQAVQQVFERNTELIGSVKSKKDKARSLITKIVNALTAASEIGGPMASMYLLKHPGHYTSHKFRACYWRGYVYEVMQAWSDSNNIAEGGKSTVVVALENNQTGQGRVLPISPVLDYIWRPIEYEHVCAYDRIRLNHKKSIPKSRRKFTKPHAGNHLDDDSDFENNHHIDEQIPIANPYSADSDVDEVEVAELSDCEQDNSKPTLYGGAHP